MKIHINYKVVAKGELSGSAYYIVHNSLGEKLKFKKPPLEYDIKKTLAARMIDKIELEEVENIPDKVNQIHIPLNINYTSAYGLMKGFIEGLVSVLNTNDLEFYHDTACKILDDLKNNKNYKV